MAVGKKNGQMWSFSLTIKRRILSNSTIGQLAYSLTCEGFTDEDIAELVAEN